MKLQELIIALLVIAICTTSTTAAYVKSLERVRTSQTTATMQVIASKFESVGGCPAFADTEQETVLDCIEKLENDISVKFDTETLEINDNSFSVNSSVADGFGNPTKFCIFKTGEKIIVVSSGKNAKFESENNYSEGNFGDDIVLLVKFK